MEATRIVLIIACLYMFSSMSMAESSDSFCFPYNYLPSDKLKSIQPSETPLINGYFSEAKVKTRNDCFDLLRTNDMAYTKFNYQTGYQCYVFNLNATGTDVASLSNSYMKEDKQVGWMSKADFNLTEIDFSPYTAGIVSEKALSLEDGSNAINLGDRTDSCLGDLEKCSNGVTFSLWMKVVSVEKRTTLYVESAGPSAGGIKLFGYDESAAWNFQTSNTIWTFGGFPFGFTPGRWQHLIGTWSEQEGLQMYVNGLLKASVDEGTNLVAVQADNKDFIIGRSGRFVIDDFLVYFRHVNKDEAKQLFLDRFFKDKQHFSYQFGTPEFELANDAQLPRVEQGKNTMNAISFNGVDNSVSLGNLRTSCFGNLDHCDDGITYSLWLKVTNEQSKDPSQTVYYLSSGAQSRWSMGVALYSRGGMMSWSFKTSTQWWRKEGQFSVKYDEWQHVVATWSPSRGVTVYKDNVEVNAFSYAMNMGTNDRHNDFVLGRPNHLKEDGQWNGEFVIDELQAYYFPLGGKKCVTQLYYGVEMT